MATTKYAYVLQRDVQEELSFRLSALALAAGTGSSGDPTLAVGAGTAGTQSAFIRFVPEDTIQTNSVGGTQAVYCPHKIQVVLETSTIANVALMTEANKIQLMEALLKKGAKVELYMSANTNAVDEADITAGNLKASIYPTLNFPLTSQS